MVAHSTNAYLYLTLYGIQISSNYLQLFAKGSHLFNGLYDVFELVPEEEPNDASSFESLKMMMQKAAEAEQNVPDSVECR